MNTIHISELSETCATRIRGHKASRRLKPYLRKGKVEIKLDGVEILSTSFLDELIAQLIKAGNTEKVIFKNGSSMVKDKLARISGIRNTTIYYQSRNGRIHEIHPKPFEPLRATFASRKPS